MSTVEERLQAFRQQKRREKAVETVSWFAGLLARSPRVVVVCWEKFSALLDSIYFDTETLKTGRGKAVGAVALLVWLYGFYVFVRAEFGLVYFAVSLLLFIYFNTRTGPKKLRKNIRGQLEPDEVSAYSVFNKNCERIPGTFTAEQYEASLRRGGGLVGAMGSS